MTREQAIAKLIPVFRQYGYEGTTVSMLSKATGLGKASLYHYFPQGKKDMAAAVLDYIGSTFSDNVLQPLQDRDEPVEKLRGMCRGLKDFYRDGRASCLLATMSIGEADNLFHHQLKQTLQTWIEKLAQVLIEAKIEPELALLRSQDAIVQIQGALILVRILDDTATFERVIATLPENLLEGSQTFNNS